jgi:lipopolysaccharide transport system permease protein
MTALLATGTGAAFAALSVRFRDISYIVPIMLQLWLFCSPVVYSSSAIPEKWRLLFALNPMTGMIEAFRSALLETKTGSAPLFAGSCLGVLVILPVGLMIFRRLERDFADVI